MLPPSLQHIIKPQNTMLLEFLIHKPHQKGQRIRQSGRGWTISQGRTEKSGNVTTRTGISGDTDINRRTQTVTGLGFTQTDRRTFTSKDPTSTVSTQASLGIQHQTPRGGSFFSQGGSRGRRATGGGGRRNQASRGLFPRTANLIGRVIDSKLGKSIVAPFRWLSHRN